jgi:hypothetical protein
VSEDFERAHQTKAAELFKIVQALADEERETIWVSADFVVHSRMLAMNHKKDKGES